MTADQMTPEQAMRDLSELTMPQWARDAVWIILDALTASRAEVQRLTELRDALVESMGIVGGIPMTDRLADALALSGVDAVREVEAVVKESSTTARRSDAGRVEVPELTADEWKAVAEMEARNDYSVKTEDLVAFVFDLLRSRLSPSPQPSAFATDSAHPFPYDHDAMHSAISQKPSADVVVVPDLPGHIWASAHDADSRDQCISEVRDWYRDWIFSRLSPSPQPSADVVVVRRALLQQLANGLDPRHFPETLREIGDALRSSTNHDQKET